MRSALPYSEDPSSALVSIDPRNGQIEAMASSSSYDAEPVQPRRPGPPPARLDLQGLRPDHGDQAGDRPLLDLLHLQAPRPRPARVGPLGSEHRRRGLPGDGQPAAGDGRLRQHRLRPARPRRRPAAGRADGEVDGDRKPARRHPGRGDRRPADRRLAAGDGRRLRDPRRRRHPPQPDRDPAASSSPAAGSTSPSAPSRAGWSPKRSPTRSGACCTTTSPKAPAPPPTPAAPARAARRGRPTTSPTPGSPASSPTWRRWSGSATRSRTRSK